jgi:hypothetical protein
MCPERILKISSAKLFARSSSRFSPSNLITLMNWLFYNCLRTSLKIEEVDGSDYLRFLDMIGAWLDRVCARKIYICLRGLLGLLGFAVARRNCGDPVLRPKPRFKVICQRSCPQQKRNLRSGVPSWLRRSTPYSMMENSQ